LIPLNLEKPKKKKPGKQTNLKTKPLNQKIKKKQQKNKKKKKKEKKK
jgi:hypothetical protein